MKNLPVIITTILFSLPLIAFGEGGGYQWEQRQDAKKTTIQYPSNSGASKMDHTAVQHKRWLFDDPLPRPLKHKKLQKSYRTGKHKNHTAAQHKNAVFGRK